MYDFMRKFEVLKIVVHRTQQSNLLKSTKIKYTLVFQLIYNGMPLKLLINLFFSIFCFFSLINAFSKLKSNKKSWQQ